LRGRLIALRRPGRIYLRLRWRQESSLKFLRRQALREQARSLTQHIQTLQAQLGRALEDNDENRRPTTRGLKIAHADLRRQIAQQRQLLARVEAAGHKLNITVKTAEVHRNSIYRSIHQSDPGKIASALYLPGDLGYSRWSA
jgi:uncharacterized protein YlxW (UPF0749 family)